MNSLVGAEICPPPECTLSPRDVEGLADELNIYHARFELAFLRPEQFWWTGVYLKGLLGEEPRESVKPIAWQAGVNVRDLQHFIYRSEPLGDGACDERSNELVAGSVERSPSVAERLAQTGF